MQNILFIKVVLMLHIRTREQTHAPYTNAQDARNKARRRDRHLSGSFEPRECWKNPLNVLILTQKLLKEPMECVTLNTESVEIIPGMCYYEQ